jgi:hypothetical protein
MTHRAVSIVGGLIHSEEGVIVSEIDWTVTWKLFHYQFWCIYLCVGVPSRLFLARRIKTASLGNAVFYAIASSLVASLLSTWFPIIPLAGAILINMAGEAAREYALITVPMVAVLMGLETALVDAIFVRMLLKGSPRVGFRAFLVINTLNATIALALGLAWAHRHMPIFIAALDICC